MFFFGWGGSVAKGFSFSIQIMATIYFGQYEIPHPVLIQYKHVLDTKQSYEGKAINDLL